MAMLGVEIGFERFGDDVRFLDLAILHAAIEPHPVEPFDQGRREIDRDHHPFFCL